ncbi:hypothetical protein EDB80DRAFT_218529 [Ilyonectria destructans]|nr:hypothetical protein EDB80DRAFT_218529 [Ilyonectria destructans]
MATLSLSLSLLHIITHPPPPSIHPHPSQIASAQQPNKPRHTPITKYYYFFQVQKKPAHRAPSHPHFHPHPKPYRLNTPPPFSSSSPLRLPSFAPPPPPPPPRPRTVQQTVGPWCTGFPNLFSHAFLAPFFFWSPPGRAPAAGRDPSFALKIRPRRTVPSLPLYSIADSASYARSAGETGG